MQLVIVTGVSGAGKSTALKALEDLGYYCVDNMPLPLLPRFTELLTQSGEVGHAALVVDAREGDFLSAVAETFGLLEQHGHQIDILFLDAPNDTLVRRFSETRRRHPLAGENLREGILAEREILSELRERSTASIDTGPLNVHQLKGVIQERYRRVTDVLGVTLLSFGFKHGLPTEADMVFDVRSLPNPYFVESLSALTGADPQVSAYVFESAAAKELLERVASLIQFLLPLAESEGKAYFTIAVGCTGGRHRSVAFVEALAKTFTGKYPLTVRHRDLTGSAHQ